MRCKRFDNPDIICVSYSSMSNRATRLLLLEVAAEAIIELHGAGCPCVACKNIHEAMKIKERRIK